MYPLVGSITFQYPLVSFTRNDSPELPIRRASGIRRSTAVEPKRFPLTRARYG